MRAPDTDGVHEAGDVISHVGDVVRSGGLRTAAGIPVVEDDHLERLGQGGDLRQRPQCGVVPDAHDQHQRRPFAMHLEVELLTIGLDRRGC